MSTIIRNTNIEIGEISIRNLDGYSELVISGCKSSKKINREKSFELSIKNTNETIICTIPKLKSFYEINTFNIICRFKSFNRMILSDEIIINDMPILKDIKLNNDIISIDQNITYIKSATLYKAKKMENQYIFYIKDITIQNSIEVIIEIKLQDTNETEEINRCFLFNTLISCSFEASESLIENEYDITIKDGFSIPLYNTTILKSKLEGYSTYTVKAGKIQKNTKTFK